MAHKRPELGETRFLVARNGIFGDIGMLIRIGLEFWRGTWKLRGIGPAITVFGSARFGEGHPYYELARKTGKLFGEAGYTVMTGGGPGIMEAANRGAKEAGGYSVGCNIILPYEQSPNPYLDRAVTFFYFFVRKIMLVKYSYAFVIMPGGMGTMDELSEAITLIQTGKIYNFPVILVGDEHWSGFRQWVEKTLVPSGAVSPTDLSFMHFTHDPEEVLRIVDKTFKDLAIEVKPVGKKPVAAR
jgi:uncharacterized protein (TIGR00730 family)